MLGSRFLVACLIDPLYIICYCIVQNAWCLALLQLKQIREPIGYRRVLTAGKQIKERTYGFGLSELAQSQRHVKLRQG
jgi:hypothetical protein